VREDSGARVYEQRPVRLEYPQVRFFDAGNKAFARARKKCHEEKCHEARHDIPYGCCGEILGRLAPVEAVGQI